MKKTKSIVLTHALFCLMAAICCTGCDEMEPTVGNEKTGLGQAEKVYNIQMYPDLCQSSAPFWESFIEEKQAVEKKNSDAYQAAKDEAQAYESLEAIELYPYDDLNTKIEQLFDSLGEDWQPIALPKEGNYDDTVAIFGPFTGVYNGKEISFVISRNRDLVAFEDGTIGFRPIFKSIVETKKLDVSISGDTLFEKCEDTGLHCDPAWGGDYYLYDISDYSSSVISTDPNEIEYVYTKLEIAFSYDGEGGGELAPASLTAESCVGIDDVYVNDDAF